MNLLSIFFPKRCVGCGRVGTYICSSCISSFSASIPVCPACERPSFNGITHPRCRTSYGLDGLTTFFVYRNVVQRAVKELKYRLVTDVVGELFTLIPKERFEFLAGIIRKRGESIVVPIPLHTSREKFRGFNQSELIGIFLANRLTVRLNAKLLRRAKNTVPQVEMTDRKKRMTNMKGVFAIRDSRASVPNSVILVDDVFTTGATLQSASSVLKRAGATYVWGVTIAR